MRVMIADDEPIALERLRLSLACLPDVELVGAAASGRELCALARELSPDVIVLDIQMPGMNGLDAARQLRELPRPPAFVFMTAHAEHAVTAFELAAVDYLLKPARFERVREALKRAETSLANRSAEARFADLHKMLETMQSRTTDAVAPHRREFWLKSKGALTRRSVDDVDLVEADGDYVCIRLDGEAHHIKASITGLESELDPAQFLRIHRSTIVNLRRVRSVRRRGKGAISLVLQSGALLSVGPSYVKTVLAALDARPWR